MEDNRKYRRVYMNLLYGTEIEMVFADFFTKSYTVCMIAES
jgi:hypothetical protein